MRVLRRVVVALAVAALAGVASAEPPDRGTLILFAIDTSGSLTPADLARAGTLANGILAGLPMGTEAALFTFDDQPRLVVRRTSQPREIAAAVAGLRRQGRHTALNDALYDGARYLRDAGPGRRAIVLITDGRDEESAVELADGLAVAEQAAIPVFTVGVGRVEERVLRRVAKLTGGQYAPLRAARPSMIAARIAGLDASPEAADPQAAARDRPRPPAIAASPAPADVAPESRGARPLVGIALAIAVFVAGVLFLLRRRGAAARVEEDERRPDAPAPTLLERMSSTEEYLEKTVTLQERPVLTITRGPNVGQVFELGARSALSIGRAKANEIVVEDVSVSSEHCRIRPEDGHFVLHDLKSTNGTFVNERRVTRHVLQEGDIVKIGETSLLFKTDLKRT
jgi:FHA domain-containing protein/von Willebrand factor type A domain-containing protein